MVNNICYSGGCHGADIAWGKAAGAAGHEVIHYGFQGMNQSKEKVPVHILNQVQLLQADPFLKQANRTLYRRFPTQSVYVNSLLRRNFWQIKDSERVYAVAPINDNMVQGGTGWATQMAIDKGIWEIYCFNLIDNKWNQWLHGHHMWIPLDIDECQPSKPHGKYTAIGSREITFEGEKAIKDLYV